MDPTVIDKLITLRSTASLVLELTLRLGLDWKARLVEKFGFKSIKMSELEKGKLYAIDTFVYAQQYNPEIVLRPNEAFLLLDWGVPEGPEEYVGLVLVTADGLKATVRLRRYTIERRVKKL